MIRMTRQRWLVLFVVAVAVAAHLSGASSFLTWESLKKHRNSLQVLVQNHSIEAPILFVLLYAILVALALPGATIMTLAAGIIFTQPWSTIVSVLGAATGACCNYYLSTCAFKSEDDGNAIRDQLGLETKDQKQGEKRFANGVGMFYGLISWKKIAKGIKENEAVYMLLLRLVPIFPFWFVNIAPSVLGVKFSTFAWTTYVGIVPGSFVYTQCGFGLASMMEEDLKDEKLMSFLFKGIFNKHTAGGLVLLFLWLCFLLVLRWWVSKRTKERKLKMKAEKKATKQQKKQERLMKLTSDKERNDNDNNKQTEKTIVRKRIGTDCLDDEANAKHKKYGREEVDLGELEHDSSSEGESGEDVKEEMLEVREGEK